jgi:hypothetical protein
MCITASADGGGAGECIQTCTQGPALTHINDPLSPNKCQGRNDVACLPVNTEGTVFGCVPVCGEDSQCPTGEACDQRAAVCVPKATASTGTPTGTKCDPNATTPTCEGTCVQFGAADGGAGPAVCSQICVVGGMDLATTPNCGGDSKGICGFTNATAGAGDQGFCAAACTASSQCDNADGFFCFPITGLTGTGAGMTNNGFCFGTSACASAADCTAQTGTTCVDGFCISTKYPIATDGGTGDAGGDAGSSTDAGDGG